MTKHIFANGIEIAVVSGTNSEAIIHYTATDHLTGSSLTTNASDAKEELLDYLPFGTIRIDQKAGDYTDQRKFAGMEYDNDTGLSYANARYYDSNTGRFISQDPAFLLIGDKKKFEEKYERTLQMHLMDPQSLNSYAYVNNNPLKYTDPEGEIVPLVAIAAGWAITELALSVYDAYNAGKTIMNPNASWTDKGIAVAGAGIGLIAPGGGYGKAGNIIKNISSYKTQLRNIKVINFGKTAYRGNINLAPTLNAISKGTLQPRREISGIKTYLNTEGHSMLDYSRGNQYYEYNVIRSGAPNNTAERVICGTVKGDMYYSPDHYKTLISINK